LVQLSKDTAGRTDGIKTITPHAVKHLQYSLVKLIIKQMSY